MTRKNRNDGICPHCGLRPRVTWATGRRAGWCKECKSRGSSEATVRRYHQNEAFAAQKREYNRERYARKKEAALSLDGWR